MTLVTRFPCPSFQVTPSKSHCNPTIQFDVRLSKQYTATVKGYTFDFFAKRAHWHWQWQWRRLWRWHWHLNSYWHWRWYRHGHWHWRCRRTGIGTGAGTSTGAVAPCLVCNAIPASLCCAKRISIFLVLCGASFQSFVLCATQFQRFFCNTIQLCGLRTAARSYHDRHTAQRMRDRHDHGAPPCERRPDTGQRNRTHKYRSDLCFSVSLCFLC